MLHQLQQAFGLIPNIAAAMAASPVLINGFGPRNMLHLIFDPQGMRPFVADWDNVSRILLQRVYRESVGHVIDDNTRRLLDELLAYPDVPRDWKANHAPSATLTMPVIPLGFVRPSQAKETPR